MKRIRIILIFLFLGAILNAAVAWGCATWIITPSTTMRTAWVELPGLKNVKGWNFIRKDAIGATQLIAMAMSSQRGEYVELDEVLPVWSNLAMQINEAAEEARQAVVKQENATLGPIALARGPIVPTMLLQNA